VKYSGQSLLLDIYVPSLKLAFEYQGYQHYHDLNLFGFASTNRMRDVEKSNACSYLGITLIEIPYWWRRDKASIGAILHQNRPDIISN